MKRIVLLSTLLALLSACGTVQETEKEIPKQQSASQEEEQTEQRGEKEQTASTIDIEKESSLHVSAVALPEYAKFEIIVENKSEKRVDYTFNSGKKYNYVILSSNNDIIYEFEKERTFTQAQETITLQPGEKKVWVEKWNYEVDGKRMEPGKYTVKVNTNINEVNNKKVKSNLNIEEKIEVPEENTAFRNIEVIGKNGEYTVSGEARVFEATFFYTVDDGHDYIIDETLVKAKEGAPTWSPFEITISILEGNLPDNGVLNINIYERSAKDGSKSNLYYMPLQRFE
jgi:uncharacterized protein YceK